ncbi:hypothetical protein ACFYP4_09605 [Streptomyces sp. NPDC005551]|uniref:hypothetical protein n=1 Tax=unclassified Streptomyces TaxID=2593676 RepID=UPI0033D55165
MEKSNTFLAEHLWLQVVLSILAAGGLIMLVSPGESPVAVLGRLAVTSVGAVIVLSVVRRREKRAAGGSATGLVSLDQKLRRGEVPADPAERQAMRELVTQRLHRTRHRVAATVFLVLMSAFLLVATAMTAGPRQTIGFSLVAVGSLSWMIYAGNRQNRRLRHMRDVLDASPAAADAGAGSPDRR